MTHPTHVILVLTLGSCGPRDAPEAPAAPSVEAPAIDTEAPLDEQATLAFGPLGTTLGSAPNERFLDVPSDDGTRRVDLRDPTGTSFACTDHTGAADIIVADIDGDTKNELFVAWTFSTGVGTMGAVDQLEVCGWRWEGDTAVALPTALTSELAALGIVDGPAIARHHAAKRQNGSDMAPVAVVEVPHTDDKMREFAIGEHVVRLTQTGRYHVQARLNAAADGPSVATLFGLSPEAIGTASRPWDYDGQWDEIEVDGKAACCGFDLTAEAGPRITSAWTDGAITYALLAQEQSESASSCQVLALSSEGAGRHELPCSHFEGKESPARLPE
jgi:hypothetical protein